MINLGDNTNAWGMPPAARRALAAMEQTSAYPSPYADGLKAAIAEYTGLPTGMIATGCGSDDILDSVIRVFGRAGGVAFPEPTFVMIPIFTRLNAAATLPVPLTAGSGLDVDRMLDSGASVLYVCSPNNPTGNALDRGAVEDLVRRSSPGQVVVIDEAYAEFAGVSLVDLVQSSDRVLVTRTFSKAFGLAGLRVGYALGSPSIIASIEDSRGPFKVNAMAERAAVAALRDDVDWVKEHVALALDNRGRFESALTERGITPVPSSANFVYFTIDGAAVIAAAMRERGVAVRAFATPSALRITIGTWPMMVASLAAFDEARRECA